MTACRLDSLQLIQLSLQHFGAVRLSVPLVMGGGALTATSSTPAACVCQREGGSGLTLPASDHADGTF